MELTKSDLRADLRTIRDRLSADQYRMECRQLLLQCAGVPELMNAKTVLSYWPKLQAREIDLRPLNCWLRAQGKTVLLPITEPNAEVLRMHWGKFYDERSLTMNRWGIAEPIESADILAENIDVALVPGLGFDTMGHRIGYGCGFYDYMFEYVKTYKIGLVMASCLMNLIPTESHDIPVDLIVTSTKTLEVKPC